MGNLAIKAKELGLRILGSLHSQSFSKTKNAADNSVQSDGKRQSLSLAVIHGVQGLSI